MKNCLKIILKNTLGVTLKGLVCILFIHILFYFILSPKTLTYVYPYIFFIDVGTRRRAACDLVKALAKHFEAKITSVFTEYVNVMLQVILCYLFFSLFQQNE